MSAVTTRSGDNFNYNTAASIINVNSNVIQRTTLTADSVDTISLTATALMTGYLNSTAAAYDGSSVSVTIQNTSSSFAITMTSGVEDGTLVGGSGYTDGTGVATTGGTGTGMTVDITTSAGAITNVVIADFGSGYVEGDTITVSGGTGGTFDFSGIAFTPTVNYVIAPEGSAKFTFFKDSTTNMFVMAENSRTLYGPAAASTDNGIIVFDGTSGQLTSSTGVTIDASDNIAGIGTISVTDLILRDGDTNTITLTAPADVTPSNYTITFPAAVGSSGQILQTVDGAGTLAWVTPGTGPNESFYGFGPATTPVTVTGTMTTVVVVTDVNVGTFVNTSGSVAIPATGGDYLVSYTAQFQTLDQTGGRDASFAAQILHNAGVASGSITECYLPEFNGDLIRPSCSKTFIITLAASDTIALQVARTAGTSTGQIRVDQCTLTIRRLV